LNPLEADIARERYYEDDGPLIINLSAIFKIIFLPTAVASRNDHKIRRQNSWMCEFRILAIASTERVKSLTRWVLIEPMCSTRWQVRPYGTGERATVVSTWRKYHRSPHRRARQKKLEEECDHKTSDPTSLMNKKNIFLRTQIIRNHFCRNLSRRKFITRHLV
jgi:hypothetical protein